PSASGSWQRSTSSRADPYRASRDVDDLDVRLRSDAHGVCRDEVGPYPVMVLDDPVRAEVRPVADRVAVGDGDDVKAQCRRGPDRRIDTQIGGASGHEESLGAEPREILPQRCAEEWIVQGLADDAVGWLGLDRAEEAPARGQRLEVVARRP